MDKKNQPDPENSYAYNEWRGTNTLAENLFIWQFFLVGGEFPGWRNDHLQTLPARTRPSTIRSIWERPDHAREILLGVEIFECPSHLAAHEFLRQRLPEYHLPLLTRQEIGIGDVAFAFL